MAKIFHYLTIDYAFYYFIYRYYYLRKISLYLVLYYHGQMTYLSNTYSYRRCRSNYLWWKCKQTNYKYIVLYSLKKKFLASHKSKNLCFPCSVQSNMAIYILHIYMYYECCILNNTMLVIKLIKFKFKYIFVLKNNVFFFSNFSAPPS